MKLLDINLINASNVHFKQQNFAEKGQATLQIIEKDTVAMD